MYGVQCTTAQLSLQILIYFVSVYFPSESFTFEIIAHLCVADDFSDFAYSDYFFFRCKFLFRSTCVRLIEIIPARSQALDTQFSCAMKNSNKTELHSIHRAVIFFLSSYFYENYKTAHVQCYTLRHMDRTTLSSNQRTQKKKNEEKLYSNYSDPANK